MMPPESAGQTPAGWGLLTGSTLPPVHPEKASENDAKSAALESAFIKDQSFRRHYVWPVEVLACSS
jgi:hypothetical protein